jgi:hypothetical protein
MFLTGAMALVTWGVWHTLTQHKHPHAGPDSDEPAGKRSRDLASRDGSSREGSSRGKPDDGALRGNGSRADGERYDPSRKGPGSPGAGPEASVASGDPFAQNNVTPASPGAKIGPFDPGPPLPGGNELTRDNPAPRVGRPAPAPKPAHEEPGAPAKLEALRLGDQFDATMKRVKEAKAAGQFVPAYEELSSWYPKHDKLSLANAKLMFKELDDLAREVLYSQKSYFSQPYVVSGETLADIAKPLSVPPELLVKINDIKRPDQIRGQQLKVVHGPFYAELRRSTFELTLLVGEKRLYAGRFRVGIGPEGAQPGTYKVVQKEMFPVYYPDPNNRSITIPRGDPRNALGSRLIVFKSAEGDGAFHGTNDPLSVGKSCKEGGVRLSPKDIEDLYDMLIENESQVIVRE